MSKVRCTHCNTIYDLGGVEVIHRYSDCDVFTSPCCDRTVDSRQWKSLPDYERLDEWELRQARMHRDGLYGTFLQESGL